MKDSQKESAWKVDFRTFSILLLLAAIPILVGTWWLFASHEEAELDATGLYLSNLAETAFSSVNSYLQNQIISVATLTEVPVLRAAVTQGNVDLGKNLAEVRQSIPKMDAAWRAGDINTPQVKAVLNNPASHFLHRYIDVKKQYRDIIVTDFLGRVVAASSKSPQYYWAHEEWWRETYGEGFRGGVYLGDVRYDGQLKTYLIDVCQPFIEMEEGVIGVIRVVVDLQGIDASIGSMQAGPGTSVALIHARGDVISAPGYSSLRQALYPATLDILNARDRSKNYFLSTNPAGLIFGLTQKNFRDLYPRLNWIVTSSENVDNVLRPVRRLRAYLFALVAGVFMAALIAALMLSRVESKPIIETDPHLEKL
jgi:hypothetical protein